MSKLGIWNRKGTSLLGYLPCTMDFHYAVTTAKNQGGYLRLEVGAYKKPVPVFGREITRSDYMYQTVELRLERGFDGTFMFCPASEHDEITLIPHLVKR